MTTGRRNFINIVDKNPGRKEKITLVTIRREDQPEGSSFTYGDIPE
jgi:hypothetical protein